ncbi:MAG: acyl-CoA dehydrogenase family protein [Thermodesulfobacteriota bacterium]|nr:acyl-CoA dehydrogenase family protein [Thermodesulfobacteriota bacterium]
MDFELSWEDKLLRQTFSEFMEKELEPRYLEMQEQDKEGKSDLIWDFIHKLYDLGFGGLGIPEEYGGEGLGYLPQCLVNELFGPYFGIFMMAHPGLTSYAFVTHGSEEHKKKYLPEICKGNLFTAAALTEPEAGSDLSSISTRAVRDGDYYVINGAKRFITNANTADITMVFALTDEKLRMKGGMSAILVEKGTPGFDIENVEEAMGLVGCKQCEISFNDCAVPAENLIGKEGDGGDIIKQALAKGRLHAGSLTLGLAERALQLSIEYSKQRVQFRKPICENQAIQWMLSDSATDIYAARMMIFNAAWKADRGKDIATEGAMVKLFCTEMAKRVVDRAVQIFGGSGYMKGLPIEGMYRDVRFTTIAEGSSEIQRIIIASHLLRGGAIL